MFRQSCERGLSVSVKYEGPCDPCALVECEAPQVCQLDEDRRAGCYCGESCEAEESPVCGSDGLTYLSDCLLLLQACRDKTSLRILYPGTCDSGTNPCRGLECGVGEQCVVSRFGTARCECVSQCEPVVRRVCGSDGKTYDSECHLLKAACLLRLDLSLLYTGPCESEESCKDVECEPGAECVVDRGVPQCQCAACPLHYSPVCGSDGHTYSNPCLLVANNCLLSTQVLPAHQGICVSDGCANKTCGYFSTCEIDKDGVAQCVCIQHCSKEENSTPICGIDGNTYKSMCELRKQICETKLPLEVEYEGDCELCQDIVCQNGARCNAGACVCPTSCPEGLDEPVCASNLQTYKSECDMQLQACALHPPVILTVVFFGACSVKFKVAPLNVTTTTTGSPVSLLPRHPCQSVSCEHGASCEVGDDGLPRCSCLMDCSGHPLNLVCGSDLRLYNSTCAMRAEACLRQQEIRLRPLDLCRGMEVKPCSGAGAVVDEETGEELDCGSGPHRRDCPLHSYCHQTAHFARCCPKERGVYLKSCQDSWYGCCPDKKTPAQGPQQLGCPSLCGCNKLGSYSDSCVGEDSEQCDCRPGVGGLKCDRCEPGYWGLPKITSGFQGCLVCGCSALGSVREDCEQMTGRCVCKPGVQGHKCDSCADSQHVLTADGCVPALQTTPRSSCDDVQCDFGAECEPSVEGPRCICTQTCPEGDIQEMICGDDGKLYASKCQLKLFVCQIQKQIDVQDMSYCTDDEISVTELTFKQRVMESSFKEVKKGSILSALTRSPRHLKGKQIKQATKRKKKKKRKKKLRLNLIHFRLRRQLL